MTPAPNNEPKRDPKLKRAQVIFFDSFAAAKRDKERIRTVCQDCEQMNVVVREEGNMDDEELLAVDPKVKVFAGEAWHLIHTRRQEDGWY